MIRINISEINSPFLSTMSLLNKENFLEELPSLNNSILFRETCMIPNTKY